MTEAGESAAFKRMRLNYVLDAEHNVVPTEDILVWGAFFESADRIVDTTIVRSWLGAQRVSTVFIGLDQSFGHGDVAIVFETMIFGGPCDCWTDRYATWADAERGHRIAVLIAESNRHTIWQWIGYYWDELVKDCHRHMYYMQAGLLPDDAALWRRAFR